MAKAPRRLTTLLLACCLPLAWAAAAAADASAPSDQPSELLAVKDGWLNSARLLQLPDWLNLGFSWTAEPFVNPVGAASS